MPFGNANERGAWAVGTTYAIDDVVGYDGVTYMAVAASTGVNPSGDSSNTYWAEIALSGSEADIPGQESALGQTAIRNAVVLNESAYSANYGDVVFATVTTAILLPAPAEAAEIEVISNGASITATVSAPTGSLVNGVASVTVTTQYTKKTFRSDGFNWFAA
jgi:hypothetical protein